ncbi:MAG: right-handed parallel beta-helix repeat-containing protein [Acidobacteriota bacterium]
MSIALASIVPPSRLDHFVVTTPGTQTAGTAFAITTITAQDVNNATVTGYTGTVDFTETGGGAGGTVVPSQSSAFTAGVLSGQSVTLTKSGAAVTITVTDHLGTKTGVSGGFTVNPGTATKVKVETASNGSGTVVPAQNVTAGSAITVYAISRDANDNFVANIAADSWSLAGITGGVVAGDLVAAGDSKSATFTGHLVGTAAVHAAAAGLTSTDSGTLTVVAGAAFKLAFGTQPSNAQGGSAIAPAITVRILDSQNNLTTSTASVTAAIGTNPGGGVLSGTKIQAGVAGVATFNDLAIDKAGVGYTLTATSAGLTGTTSGTFNIVGTARWVDNALGADVNAGTQAAPFATIGKAISVLGASGTAFVRVGNSQSGSPYAANNVVAAAAAGTSTYSTRVLGIASGATLPLVTGTDPNADGGFDVQANYVTIDGFEIRNTQVGVYSEGANTGARISNNYVVSGHFGYGIILDTTSNAWVHDNRVEQVSGGGSFFGIWDYTGNGNVIELNKVKGFGSDGIVSHYSTGLVIRRNILKNNPFGIHVSNAAGPVTLYNNTVDGSAFLGIYAEQSPVAVTSRDNIIVNGGYGWAWDGIGTISSNYDDVYNNASNYGYTVPVTPGAQSISASPNFVQTVDPTAADYYRLSPGSPCIGAGIDVGYGTNIGAVP